MRKMSIHIIAEHKTCLFQHTQILRGYSSSADMRLIMAKGSKAPAKLL
jgi:hypothetical protein